MAQYMEHKKLRPGQWVFDAPLAHGNNDGWRKVSTTPEKYGDQGKLIVFFVDGGAAIEKPGYRWVTR